MHSCRIGLLVLGSVFVFALAAPPVAANGKDGTSDVAKLRKELEAEKKARAADEKRITALERSKQRSQKGLEQAVDSYLQEREMFAGEPEHKTLANAGTLIDLSAILDLTVGGSTATNDALGVMNVGDHDPHVRGFNARNEELVVSANVDPYFYGFLDFVMKIDQTGDTALELEEAYALTTALPASLQLKVGQFFTEFGRLNPSHPHTWEFLNFPVILGRVFGGDGWRGPGFTLFWKSPGSDYPVTLLGGVQNAVGGTQAAFLGAEGDFVGDHLLMHHSIAGLGDFSYHFRAEVSHDYDVGEKSTLSALAGFSFGYGPNGTGSSTNTRIYGADLFLKWRPLATDAGWPFLKSQTEFVYRDYDAAAQTYSVDDGMGGTKTVSVGNATYRDWGFYSEIVYAFRRPWTVGLRYDYAHTNGAFFGNQQRLSAALTYYTSEFARMRLQVSYDFTPGIDSVVPGAARNNVSVWLNFDFSLGKHGAHKF